MDVLIKARIDLLRTNPFYGRLALVLGLRELDDIDTAATDGEYLYYNINYVQGLSPELHKSLILHELLHVALGHLWRKNDRDAHLWNIACDYVVNAIVKRDGLPVRQDWVYDATYANMSAEEVYEKIKKDARVVEMKCVMDGGNNKGKCSCGGSHKFWGKMAKSKKAKRIRMRWEGAIEDVAKRSKGSIPAEFERLIQSLRPQENWRQILFHYMSESKFDFDFLRRDRRTINSPFYFPDLRNDDQLENIVCVIDSSGSIMGTELNKFIAEIKEILRVFPHTKGWFINCDISIHNSCPIDEVGEIKHFYGGGGTSHIPVFEEIEKQGLQPKVVICFTDLYTDFPTKHPDYPVLWLVPENKYFPATAPFGRIITLQNGI